jgi:hypothetical protein
LSKHVDENWVNEISQDNDTAEHNEDERETVNNEDSDFIVWTFLTTEYGRKR